MSVRVTCPACDTTMTVSDEKRGSKVRCKECDKSIPVPEESRGKKQRDEEAAIQDSRKLKVKSANRKSSADDDDEGDDDRPVKMKGKPAKSGFPVLLLVGEIAAILLICVAGVGGVGALVFWPRSPADAKPAAVAEARDPIRGDVAPILRGDDAGKPINANPNIPANEKPVNVPKVLPPIVDPNAGKPLPDQIAPDAVTRVKKATVYLRVTMPLGEVSEGSGFLAVDPGLVVTNAHVVGMLKAKSQLPKNVQVVLNSGLPDEKALTGQVLGVDRNSDLAIVRIPEQGLP